MQLAREEGVVMKLARGGGCGHEISQGRRVWS